MASKWFHCVQLADASLEEKHLYRSLFDAKNPARLVLASRDGKKVVSFLGTSSDRVTWAAITSVLKHDYLADPTRAVRGIEQLLSKFDALDNRRKELSAQLDRAQKSDKKSKVKALEKELALNEVERKKLEDQREKLAKLGLRRPAKAAEKSGEKKAE
ncbi:MAG: hypothetical protein H6836_04120 [Planctomycetes bacterium]|nr:hypothetical protein [Planctomycetota bacterium]